MKKTITLMFIFYFSCYNIHENEQLIFLTNKNYKYWDLVYKQNFYNKAESITFPLYCYKFDKNGNWDFCIYKKKNRQSYYHGDIIIPKIWNFKSNKLLIIGNTEYNIIKLCNDTLIMKCDEDSVVLIRSSLK